MSFDTLAPIYRGMELMFAGTLMQQSRTSFLGDAADSRHALVVGEGPGQFLAALLAVNSRASVTCVDQSARMIAENRAHLARRRLDERRVRMNRKNFYDHLLEQDGHRIDHVRPPRDLRSWQQLPVSAIANFQPVMVDARDRTSLQEILKRHPYQSFPACQDGQLVGIVTRKDLEAAFAAQSEPLLHAVTTCRRDQTIRELQQLLINSATHLVLVLDREGGNVVGLVTLHDLLRAEANLAEQAREER